MHQQNKNTCRFLQLDNKGQSVLRAEKVVSTGLKLITAASVAQDGHIYFVTQHGAIGKLAEAKGNMQPIISIASATPSRGEGPLKVKFQANARDPEKKSLTYRWHFGTGLSTTAKNPKYTYTRAGTYMAVLSVSDGEKTSVSSTIVIQVGAAPKAGIASPTPGTLFRAGQLINLKGSASDEDSIFVEEDYTWSIRVAHLQHFHPFLSSVTGTAASFTIPTTGHPFDRESIFIVQLTVTDQNGLQGTSQVTIMPDVRRLSITSMPENFYATVDGVPQTAPVSRDSLVGFVYTVTAKKDGCTSEGKFVFHTWSDGNTDVTRQIVVPAVDWTVTAVYRHVQESDQDLLLCPSASAHTREVTFTFADFWFEAATAHAGDEAIDIARWSDYHSRVSLLAANDVDAVGVTTNSHDTSTHPKPQILQANALQNWPVIDLSRNAHARLCSKPIERKTSTKYTVVIVAAGKHRGGLGLFVGSTVCVDHYLPRPSVVELVRLVMCMDPGVTKF